MGKLYSECKIRLHFLKVSCCQDDKGRSVPHSVLYKVIAVHGSVTILDNILNISAT